MDLWITLVPKSGQKLTFKGVLIFLATYESAQISYLTIQSVSLSRIISANFERIVYSLRISRTYIFLLNFFCLPWRRKVRYTIYCIGFFLADSFKTLLGTPIFCIRFACVRSTPTLPVILEREILIPMNTTKKLQLTVMLYSERPRTKENKKKSQSIKPLPAYTDV